MKLKVEVKNVFKSFPMQAKQSEKLLDLFRFNSKKEIKEFVALRDVSFEVYEGDTVGLIGLNGSGKSTISNILAQVIQPTRGKVNIEGETSLIAISAGLNTNLTGLENIDLKCMMHGMSKSEIEAVKDDIIEFSDIGDYIYQPVKNYSSGMRSRLGFAISVHTDPDILIIDEALSVGDSTFTKRCLDKMREFKEKGKTIFFISHSTAQVQQFCEKAIWMHYGEVKEIGDSTTVIKNYQEFVKWFNNLNSIEKKDYKEDYLQKQIQIKNQFCKKDQKKRQFNVVDVLISAFLVSSTIGMLVLLLLGYK